MAKPAKIVYLPAALRDLEESFDYVRLDGLARAEKLLDKIDREVSRLSRFPLLGVVPRDERLQKRGYRVLIVDDYLIFYVFKGGSVKVRRVIHGARRYDTLL